ncbi:hypothetical protein Pla123a_07610 [Posidoniimonas polymericola]|uniref:PEP-CTERM protein-sorting domain-containing protein n=1 Tax=Posidoniimonas polymericola TaxID=2528002 RepID=A0A5C5ZF04_9BACT|nr:hypothetical protein [Posidoniimonas polymericola]TWT85954.1 hypothetical protein Pla123a_07610 [Posidoniimonas polymericola]
MRKRIESRRLTAVAVVAAFAAITVAPAYAVVAAVDSVALNLGANGGTVSAVTVNDVILADLTLPTSAAADAIRTGWNANGGTDPVDASTALGNNVITDGLLNTNATFQFGQGIALNDVLVFMEIDTQLSEGVTFFPVDSGGGKIGDYSLTLANNGDRSSAYGPQLVPGNYDLKIVDVADPLANFNVRGVSFSLSDFSGSAGNLSLAQGFRVEDELGGVGVDPSFAAIAAYLPPNADFVAPAGVGIEDFDVLRSNYLESGLTQAEGDANFDGVVDRKDYYVWRTEFLAAGGSMEGLSLFGVAAPEPSAMGAAAIALALLGVRRRVARRDSAK